MLQGMCLMAAESIADQLRSYQCMADSIGLCETEDDAYHYELEILRLEARMAECRGIAAYTQWYIWNKGNIGN